MTLQTQIATRRPHRRKLSPEQQEALVREYAAGENVYALALKYDISTGTIYNIVRPYRVPASAIVTVVTPAPPAEA